MENSIFLGICWDYSDWVGGDREKIERRVRIELNEWNREVLEEYKGVLEEIVKEVVEDLRELSRMG
jgi:vacuolar-type H+-ATPase subunit E/Vma4